MNKLYTLKVKNNTLARLKELQTQYGLSSLNDTVLFLIMKYQLCETERARINEDSQF